MTKDEALKLALEALQKIYIAREHEEYIRVWWPACEQAIAAIKEALAQPEEQSCFCHDGASLQSVSGGAAPEGYLGKVTLLIDGEYVDYVKAQPVQESVAYQDTADKCRLETVPARGALLPQRQWVGLTDDEISALSKGHMTRNGFARNIEQALKEKNNG